MRHARVLLCELHNYAYNCMVYDTMSIMITLHDTIACYIPLSAFVMYVLLIVVKTIIAADPHTNDPNQDMGTGASKVSQVSGLR